MIALNILFAFLSVSLLGGLLGLGLAVASKFFAVKKDERVELAESALPGLNCGACGFAGCSGYAEAIIEKGAELTLCAPGGGTTLRRLSEIMGVEVSVTESARMVAQIKCRGGRETAKYKFDYTGLKDCNALHALYGGDKVCSYGCLGLGSCIKVCPVDAIDYDSKGLVVIDPDACIACGKCIEICPTGVIGYVPHGADYLVACNSKDKGALVRKYCSVGCIGCKLCEKKSPDGGYVIEDFLASIDYEKQGDRSAGAEACPSKCIIRMTPSVESPLPDKEDSEGMGEADTVGAADEKS